MTTPLNYPRWPQILGLALLQAAVALCWVIYNLYLPKLLQQLGFPAGLGLGLLILENALGTLMEPLMGSLADRHRYWVGTRLPFTLIGILLAAGLFILLPSSQLWGDRAAWLLPIFAVAWALAMTFFRSPVLSLLGNCILTSRLPQAASLLTLAGALIGAVNLVASQTIVSWGAPAAFTLGSVVLLMTAGVLRLLKLEPQPSESTTASFQQLNWLNLACVFGVGLGMGFGTRSMLQALQIPPAIPLSFFPGQLSMMALFTMAHVLSVLPAGYLASRWQHRHAMLLGIVLIGLALPLLAGLGGVAFIPVLLGIGLSFVANGTLPFALAAVPAERAGLGMGLFFGGAALANSALASVASAVVITQIQVLALMASLGYLLIAFCVGNARFSKTGLG